MAAWGPRAVLSHSSPSRTLCAGQSQPSGHLQSSACAAQEPYTSCGMLDRLGRAGPLGMSIVLASTGMGFGVFGRVGVLLSRQ